MLSMVRSLGRRALMGLISATRGAGSLGCLQLVSDLVAACDHILLVLTLEHHHFTQQLLTSLGLLGTLGSCLRGLPVSLFRFLGMVGGQGLLDRLQRSNQLVFGGDQSQQRPHLASGDQLRLLVTQVTQLQQTSMSFVDQVG